VTPADKSRSSFQLRPAKDGGYRLIYRYPFANPAVRLVLGDALLHQYFPTAHQVHMDREGVLTEPQTITIGYFTRAGFSPSRKWIRVLELEIARKRICEDMQALYGLGGEFEAPPGKGSSIPDQIKP